MQSPKFSKRTKIILSCVALLATLAFAVNAHINYTIQRFYFPNGQNPALEANLRKKTTPPVSAASASLPPSSASPIP